MENAVKEVVNAVQKRLKNHPDTLLVAVDGRSGTGKTIVSKSVAEELGDAVVILVDDFYSRGSLEEWNKKTTKQKADFCINWKRIRTEVLEPLLAGKTASWHPFNWQTNEGLAENTISAKPARIIILDVVYSARPELADLVDLTILIRDA